ncbi:MAG: UDP-N-acetylmuramoyl-L-alanyl-D-glutamate--2,6-diaminopimelate ligase, partial [Firmicutes bacterium]|nr:UDP-N-acetylmuramoyl-L-alanyl-D-glutamate--2,6-diaminopimelate ligase [Bacillota bacterium]
MSTLLSGLEVLARGGPADVAVAGLVYDSRQAVPGSLFVAVKGLRTDGHLYIRDAAARGAVAAVLEREAETPPGMAWVRVPDSRRALSHLAAAFYGHPARRLKLVGVTGTNGKTTTTHLLAAMYRAAGERVGLIGTVENRIGGRVLPVTHTTPESLDLQRLLAEMLGAGVTTVVMEVSSHALKLHRVADCEFDRAV